MKMRITTIAIAIVLVGFAGAALAASSAPPAPDTEAAIVSECLQPGDPAGGACGPIDTLIRADFSPREIRMVTEWNTTHPDYLFDQVELLHHRLDTVLQHYITQQGAQSQIAKR